MNPRLVGTERVLGGAHFETQVAEVTSARARVVRLHVVYHVVALPGQVGAGQAPVLVLTGPRVIVRQQ